jgi:hypothetical protein
MTPDEDPDHGACVTAWMVAADGAPSEQLVEVFARDFGRLWGRAQRTLGEVTLTAIADRVLHNAAARHDVLAPLQLDDGGIKFHELRARAAQVPREQIAEGIRFFLVEFLTVLGNLTADILTPCLHAELSATAQEDRSR